MKYRYFLFRTALVLSAWIAPLAVLQAQPAGADGEPEADCLPPSHRIRVLAGPGRAILLPGFLSESGPTWMLNSFLEAQDNSNYQPVIPFEPKEFEAFTLHGDLDYTWKDRLRIRLETYQLEQDFDRDSSTRTDFFAPAKTNFRWAYFEGVRLQRYREDRRAGELLYVHPLFMAGLKLGGFVSREQYIEINDISFGSFVATTNNAAFKPATTTWSELGLVPGEYRMSSTNVGPAAHLQILPALGLEYKLAIVNRSGNFKASGVQYLNEDLNGGYTHDNAVWPFIYAESQDQGMRHNLELIFTFLCNYGVHLGFMHESFDRSYSIYVSETFNTAGRLLSQKTPDTLGYGEMFLGPHKIEKSEIYLKFSASLYFQ